MEIHYNCIFIGGDDEFDGADPSQFLQVNMEQEDGHMSPGGEDDQMGSGENSALLVPQIKLEVEEEGSDPVGEGDHDDPSGEHATNGDHHFNASDFLDQSSDHFMDQSGDHFMDQSSEHFMDQTSEHFLDQSSKDLDQSGNGGGASKGVEFARYSDMVNDFTTYKCHMCEKAGLPDVF